MMQQKDAIVQSVPKEKKRVVAPRKPRSGDLLDDRFQVMGRPLGKGGMGTVYRVRDEQENEFAVKRLDPALREEKRFEKRFLREYEAAADLNHPNIASYQELFEADGALHIRMELVEGGNLRKLLSSQKKLPVPVVAGIGRALARALEHLHQHSVVHRDLKPENILIGEDGSIKLTDFGICRLEYGAMTRTGTLLGTPRYMSPEQLAGCKGEDIGPESDLYALGVLLYESLTGKDPYGLKKKAEVLEVINVKNERDPRALPAEVEPSLAELLLALLQRDPEERPADARWLGRELGRWAPSSRELRALLSEMVAESMGSRAPKRGKAPKRVPPKATPPKAEKAVPPDPVEPGEATANEEPPPVRGIGGAFAATLLFLVVLMGLGLWYRGEPKGKESHASQSKKEIQHKPPKLQVIRPPGRSASRQKAPSASRKRARAKARQKRRQARRRARRKKNRRRRQARLRQRRRRQAKHRRARRRKRRRARRRKHRRARRRKRRRARHRRSRRRHRRHARRHRKRRRRGRRRRSRRRRRAKRRRTRRKRRRYTRRRRTRRGKRRRARRKRRRARRKKNRRRRRPSHRYARRQR